MHGLDDLQEALLGPGPADLALRGVRQLRGDRQRAGAGGARGGGLAGVRRPLAAPARGSTASRSPALPAARRSPVSATVGNPWLDAGIVPFSTIGYRNDREHWRDWFPADWISESFPGQFRNWFYSLLAMSATLEETEPFKACFTYALLRDEHGAEMHKSKGQRHLVRGRRGQDGRRRDALDVPAPHPGQQPQLRLRSRRRGAAPVPHPDLERLLLLRQLRQHRRLAAGQRRRRLRRGRGVQRTGPLDPLGTAPDHRARSPRRSRPGAPKRRPRCWSGSWTRSPTGTCAAAGAASGAASRSSRRPLRRDGFSGRHRSWPGTAPTSAPPTRPCTSA